MRYILSVALVFVCAVPAFAAGPGDTDLSWTDNATNELGFVIEKKEGTGVWAALPGNVPKDAKSAKDTTTVAGKTYTYRVRAFNNSMLDGSGSVQYSPWSNEASVTYPLVVPGAPTGLTAQ